MKSGGFAEPAFQIIEFEMNNEEKGQLEQTLNAVKETVTETGL